jgi:hypothetical protein
VLTGYRILQNDGPGSGMLRGDGLCPGLDYWSLDSYKDTGEAAGVEALYSGLLSKLRGPNPNELHGQGLFLVPGTYFYVASCHANCSAPPLGPGPQPHGCCAMSCSCAPCLKTNGCANPPVRVVSSLLLTSCS